MDTNEQQSSQTNTTNASSEGVSRGTKGPSFYARVWGKATPPSRGSPSRPSPEIEDVDMADASPIKPPPSSASLPSQYLPPNTTRTDAETDGAENPAPQSSSIADISLPRCTRTTSDVTPSSNTQTNSQSVQQNTNRGSASNRAPSRGRSSSPSEVDVVRQAAKYQAFTMGRIFAEAELERLAWADTRLEVRLKVATGLDEEIDEARRQAEAEAAEAKRAAERAAQEQQEQEERRARAEAEERARLEAEERARLRAEKEREEAEMKARAEAAAAEARRLEAQAAAAREKAIAEESKRAKLREAIEKEKAEAEAQKERERKEKEQLFQEKARAKARETEAARARADALIVPPSSRGFPTKQSSSPTIPPIKTEPDLLEPNLDARVPAVSTTAVPPKHQLSTASSGSGGLSSHDLPPRGPAVSTQPASRNPTSVEEPNGATSVRSHPSNGSLTSLHTTNQSHRPPNLSSASMVAPPPSLAEPFQDRGRGRTPSQSPRNVDSMTSRAAQPPSRPRHPSSHPDPRAGPRSFAGSPPHTTSISSRPIQSDTSSSRSSFAASRPPIPTQPRSPVSPVSPRLHGPRGPPRSYDAQRLPPTYRREADTYRPTYPEDYSNDFYGPHNQEPRLPIRRTSPPLSGPSSNPYHLPAGRGKSPEPRGGGYESRKRVRSGGDFATDGQNRSKRARGYSDAEEASAPLRFSTPDASAASMEVNLSRDGNQPSFASRIGGRNYAHDKNEASRNRPGSLAPSYAHGSQQPSSDSPSLRDRIDTVATVQSERLSTSPTVHPTHPRASNGNMDSSANGDSERNHTNQQQGYGKPLIHRFDPPTSPSRGRHRPKFPPYGSRAGPPNPSNSGPKSGGALLQRMNIGRP